MSPTSKKEDVLFAVLFWLLVVVAIAMIALYVYAYARYATTPIGEVPLWAIELLRR